MKFLALIAKIFAGILNYFLSLFSRLLCFVKKRKHSSSFSNEQCIPTSIMVDNGKVYTIFLGFLSYFNLVNSYLISSYPSTLKITFFKLRLNNPFAKKYCLNTLKVTFLKLCLNNPFVKNTFSNTLKITFLKL